MNTELNTKNTKFCNKLKCFFIDKKLRKDRKNIETYVQRDESLYHNDIINKSLDLLKIYKSDMHIGDNVYSDIEFFDSFSPKDTNTLFNVFTDQNVQLNGGRHFSKRVLENPLYEIDILNARINYLKNLETNSITDDSNLWDDMKKYEPNILWIFEEREQHIEDLMNIVFFRLFFLKSLNNSPQAITWYNIYRIILSPLIGILSPIVYFIIPFLILTWKFKIHMNFKEYIKIMFHTLTKSGFSILTSQGSTLKYVSIISNIFTLIFYFQGIFNSIEISKTLHKLCTVIIDKFNGVVKYLKAANTINNKYWNTDIFGSFISEKTEIFKDGEEDYINKLSIIDFNYFNNFGKQLHSYKFMDKDIVRSILLKSYILDFARGCIMFKNNKNFTYTEYINNKQNNNQGNPASPYTEIIGLRHPCLDKDKVVSNDCIIGPKNMILTGPNAGGKSTFIKALLINALFSQLLGISTSDNCKTTLYKNITSQINIPDCKGYESLFEAEMHRCGKNLDLLSKMDNEEHNFTLIVMDEIFNSTNPIEGIAGAYAIAKKISSYTNCTLVFTTHYVYLTKLAKLDNSRFTNYRMNVITDNDMIIFPYKLEKGSSRQYIALELLKKNGFDEEIINDAIEIKNKLVK